MTLKPIDTKSELRDIDNWYPEPKGYRRTVRDSAFDTGTLVRQGKRWKLIGPKSDREQMAQKDRCCFEVQGNTGMICGADIEGKKSIVTNEKSHTTGKFIEKLIPLCSTHKDLI